MTDIFFSYSNVDRARVQPFHDTLVAQGFEVFWDQQVPTGVDWDAWIRQHLNKSKSAIVFWSTASVASSNVRHEATVAERQGKLIPVLLERLTPEQFPMGLYTQQAVSLTQWTGDLDDPEWRKLRIELETRLMPPWLQGRVDEFEAELQAEKARRERAERRNKVMETQIAREAEAHLDLSRERDDSIDEANTLRKRVNDLSRMHAEAEERLSHFTRAADERPHLTEHNNRLAAEVAMLRAAMAESAQCQARAETRVSDLSQHLAQYEQPPLAKADRALLTFLMMLMGAAAIFVTYQFAHMVRP